VDSAGNLYIADRINGRVRKVFNGIITTVAGTGTAGFSGDNGPATSAQLYNPSGVVLDSVGNLYIADIGNNRVRKVTNGVITTVAGTGTPGFSGDNGPATSAQLNSPSGIAVDSLGNLYIADIYNNRIRKVSNGVITTIAGTGVQGFGGDNGPATSAQLNTPKGVAVDSAGNLFVADYDNNRIRKVASGVISTVAGGGSLSGNILATSAVLSAMNGVAVDSAGSFYSTGTDPFSSRVFKVSSGYIATIAGEVSRGIGFSGDNGPATSATLNLPYGIAVDASGRVYVADSRNNRIRLLTPVVPQPAVSITAVQNAASFTSGQIAPGEIIVLYGSGIGPDQLVKAPVSGDSTYPKQLADTTVAFNGIAAPIVYTWSTQISAIVPYGITGTTAQVTVTYQGQTTAASSVPVALSAPGIFTADSTGRGRPLCTIRTV
jgi:sugar lactone lactonase YvrE